MDFDLGIRINAFGSSSSGQHPQGRSRRNAHQENLKALLAALQKEDLEAARRAWHELVALNPSLAAGNMKPIGDMLASANLSAARKAFEGIYRQGQVIFGRRNAPSSPAPQSASPRQPMQKSLQDDHGVLVDTRA